ncbi:MAG TPA: 4Fe-4S binding protein [Vicinamibacterales bacterium]|nr:4Fe-4S binding protein [Vicinamibacterales bacterium]
MDAAAEGWREILQPQALDLVLLAAFLALALVSFFRKSVPLKYVTFVAAVGYLGFTKSSLVSVSDVFRLTDLSVPEFKFSLAWYAFMLFVVGSTVLWGRVYCGRVCAFGALTQLMDPILPRKMRVEIPVRIEKHANLIKYGVLAGVLVYYLVTKDVAGPIRYAEPFWMFSLFGTTAMWIGLAVLLVATVFVRNLYCRFLCPVGAALGIISNLTVFRIKRWSECKTCKICERTCEWGAIRGPKIVASECVRCDDCERLYMDQQKCPHWLILYKRKGNTVVRS